MDIVLGSYPRNMRAIGMVGPFTNKADHGAIALIDSGGVTFHVRIEASRALNFSGCDGRPSLCRGFLSFMPQDERMQRAVIAFWMSRTEPNE